MESKFKIGDRVFIPKVNSYATVIGNEDINPVWDEPSLHLRSDDGFEFYCLESNYTHVDSTAFLTELQALLRKYQAEIQGDFIEVWMGDTNITYGYCRLTPDNIFDYEK